MIDKSDLIFPLVIAVATPLLKWLIDLASENFGKRRLEYFQARIELYTHLFSIADNQDLKDRIAFAIRQDIEQFLPLQRTNQTKIFLSYSFVFYLITASAIVMFFTNFASRLVHIRGLYIAMVGSLVVTGYLVSRIDTSKQTRVLLMFPVAVAVFALAYLLNSIGIALTS